MRKPALYIPVRSHININKLQLGQVLEIILEIPDGATPEQIELYKLITDCSESATKTQIRVDDFNDVDKGIFWIDFHIPGEEKAFVLQVSEDGNKENDFVALEHDMIIPFAG